VFENILHQPVIERLKADLVADSLAPSILFSGPEYGGKGTAALELARVLGCQEKEGGRWSCTCPSCIRHRTLVSPDLLVLGRKNFFVEIAASWASLKRQGERAEKLPPEEGRRLLVPVNMLFIRSVRKLLARFNPVLWEDDPRLGKIRSQISALEDAITDFEGMASQDPGSSTGPGLPGMAELEKICGAVVKKAAKLEAEGLRELVPIAHIRRAAYWSRLAPLGKQKCVIIENAVYMQEGAKNSLLKILEEPPPRVTLVLTSSRPVNLLPTMLSRLRDYRFAGRSPREEGEVISRIFRDGENAGGIEAYMASFLPLGVETLYPLGAYFVSSAAAEAVRELRKKGREIPELLADLGRFSAPIAEKGGMGRPARDFKSALGKILKDAENFEIPALLPRFFREIGALISAWLRSGQGGPEKSAWADIWRKELNRSLEEDAYNISPPLVLERLLETLKEGMTA
jgi:DNA polymerase-3 subunit gamma/tau